MPIAITREQVESYRNNGFLVIEDLITREELRDLQVRIREYTHGGRSTDALQIQIEPRIERGELSVDHPGDGIRKIDRLIETDDLFSKLGTHPNITSVLATLIGPDIKMYRNTLLLKAPGVGSAKGMHQDSPYWPIEPMDLCSCWFAIDDATLDNGCMWVIPGEHKRALPHVKVTDDFVVQDGYFDSDTMESMPVKAGSGLFFHSLLPHYTAPNTSSTWRRAIALSYMSSHSRYTGDGESPEYLHIQGATFPGRVR